MKGFKTSQRGELATLDRVLGEFVTDFSVAVDGGAHVGGWTDVMAERFDEVHAFEPAPDTFQQLHENLCRRLNTCLYQIALMDKRQNVAVTAGVNAPSRQVSPKADGDIIAVSLDEMQLPACGFIKLDLEGCEHYALLGARETIRRHRPFVLVEENGMGQRFGLDPRAVAMLMAEYGYRESLREGVNVGYSPA